MRHPKNKAERRRVKRIKEFKIDEHEDAVQRRLRQEELEQKEALDVLRRKVPFDEE